MSYYYFKHSWILVLCLCFCVSSHAFAQGDEEDVYLIVDEMPLYKGKEVDSFAKFLMLNLKFPEEQMNERFSGTVMVRFLINTQGEIEAPQVLSGGNSIVNEIVVSLIQRSSGDWTPGKQRSKPVKVQLSIPITITY